MHRVPEPKPGEPLTPRVLFFGIQYDWGSKRTVFRRWDTTHTMTVPLGPNDIEYRCQVTLDPPPHLQGDQPITARELYNESDSLPPNFTPDDVLRRINPCRAFPSFPLQATYQGPGVLLVETAGRRFRVTVEEV